MQKQLKYQNKKISYHLEGDEGKKVMLVHGFAEDHRVWNDQVEQLKKSFQLLLPDLPGSGKSDLIDSSSMESMAEVLLAILRNESSDECIMIGHSMGGYITLAFAEKYPEKLKAFGLFHSTAYSDNEEKKQTRRKAIEFMRKNGTFEFIKATAPNLFSPYTKNEHPDLIKKMIRDYKNLKTDALINYYQAMIERPDRRSVLKNFTKPILLIFGEYDTAVPYEQGLEQSRLPLLPSLHVLHKSGHMGMWEEPKEACFILEDFIKNNVI